jgi:AsmA protein
VQGKYNGMPLKGSGHGGPVLSIRDEDTPYPVKAQVRIGATSTGLDGTLSGIVGFKKLDLRIEKLSGKSLDELYHIINVAFPATSPYSTSGRLVRDGGMIRYEKFTAKIGESDLAGTLEVDTGGKRTRMTGDITAKLLNFVDLGPLVGTDKPDQKKGVLPDVPFDSSRWDSVDADVKIRAGTIKRPDQLPLEHLNARIVMKDKVLSLDPLDFGIAGGKIAGTVRLDGRQEPIKSDLRMGVTDLKLGELFPTMEKAKASVGDLSGVIELSGTGDSVAKMLGSANGKIGVFVDGGEVSKFLMNAVAIDLWGLARTKLEGDDNVQIRCVIADFGVKNGVAKANALVFDTDVVNVSGDGTINLKDEQMDLKLNPDPKDKSVASLNSPLHVRGTFSQPKVGPDVKRLAVRGAGAVALGVLNPLLAGAAAPQPRRRQGLELRGADYCGDFFRPICCNRRDSEASSCEISSLNPAAGRKAGRTPSFAACAANSGDSTVLRIAPSSFAIASRGVPRGTAIPRQASSAASNPCSRAVATSGQAGSRACVSVASSRA